jgi:hypothetical protein
VHAKPACGKLNQRLDVLALELARRRHFLEFFSHKAFSGSLPPHGDCDSLRS